MKTYKFSRRSSVGTFIRQPTSGSDSSRSSKPPAPKLDYRSMVSVDDMPELFVSFDSKYISDIGYCSTVYQLQGSWQNNISIVLRQENQILFNIIQYYLIFKRESYFSCVFLYKKGVNYNCDKSFFYSITQLKYNNDLLSFGNIKCGVGFEN